MPLLAFLAAAAEGGAAAGPASPFEVNFGLFFWTWLVFIAFFLALRKYVWPQILKATEEREQTIRTQLAEAARLQSEAKAAMEEQRRLLDEARTASKQMLADVRAQADKERQLAVAQTKAEQDELLARARREIAAERERALAELRREAVDLSLAAAGKLVGERLDAETDRKLVTDFLASIGAKA